MKPSLLTLGAVAALAAASTASRRGSSARRTVIRGENLEQRIKRVLEEEPPEVALRVVFLMASMPKSVVDGHRRTILPGSSYESASTYLEAGILDTLRRDVSIVQARDAGRPEPRDEPERWVSLREVADYLWSWVDEGRWMSKDSHWSRSRDLVPVVDWVAQEVSRFVSERAPVRLTFGAISSTRATSHAATRLVTLDEDRMGRLLDYMLDVVASTDPRGMRSGVDYLAEKRRWEAFGMEEILGSDVRHFDKEYGITHLRGLGGRSREVNAIHQPLGHPRAHWSLWRRVGWGGGLVNLLWGIRRERGVPEGRMERRAKVGHTPESLLIHAHMMMLWRTLSRLLERDWQVALSDDLYGVPWVEVPEYEVVKKVRATRARSEPDQEWSGLRTRRRDWVPAS